MKKWALITGASGGIGSAIATKLAEQGYNLYLHYHKNKQAVLDLMEHLPVHVVPVAANLADGDGVEDLCDQLEHEVDCLIYNCGNSYVGLMTDMETEEAKKMIQLQVTSPFLLTRKLLSNMVKKKHGHIIVVTSIWGLTGASCEVLYSMVKGGQNTFVKALAKEVAPSGIYVNGVAPGIINTNMIGNLSQEDLEEIQMDIPMGRMGEPVEVANTVQFLLSEQASYVNGQIISVNGAWYT